MLNNLGKLRVTEGGGVNEIQKVCNKPYKCKYLVGDGCEVDSIAEETAKNTFEGAKIFTDNYIIINDPLREAVGVNKLVFRNAVSKYLAKDNGSRVWVVDGSHYNTFKLHLVSQLLNDLIHHRLNRNNQKLLEFATKFSKLDFMWNHINIPKKRNRQSSGVPSFSHWDLSRLRNECEKLGLVPSGDARRKRSYITVLTEYNS